MSLTALYLVGPNGHNTRLVLDKLRDPTYCDENFTAWGKQGIDVAVMMIIGLRKVIIIIITIIINKHPEIFWHILFTSLIVLAVAASRKQLA